MAGDEVCSGSNCVCYAQVKVNSYNCAVCKNHEWQCTVSGTNCAKDGDPTQSDQSKCSQYGGTCTWTCIDSLFIKECKQWSDFVDCNQSKGHCEWTGVYSDCAWSGNVCSQTNRIDTRWCCGPGSCSTPTNTPKPKPPGEPTDPPPPSPTPGGDPWCTVSLSSNRVGPAQAVTARSNGAGYTSGNEAVRLWVEEKSGTAINPVPANVVTTYTDPSSGRKHYQLAGCTSAGGAKCASDMTWTGTLPLGEYYFHCDQPDVTKICSGNPFCDYETTENPPAPVTYACNGWMSCGGDG